MQMMLLKMRKKLENKTHAKKRFSFCLWSVKYPPNKAAGQDKSGGKSLFILCLARISRSCAHNFTRHWCMGRNVVCVWCCCGDLELVIKEICLLVLSLTRAQEKMRIIGWYLLFLYIMLLADLIWLLWKAECCIIIGERMDKLKVYSSFSERKITLKLFYVH